MTKEEVGHAIIGAALKVHSAVGPGLLESAYEACPAHELERRCLRVRKQAVVPIKYENLTIDNGYRIDLLVRYRRSFRCIGASCLAICGSEAMREGIVRLVNGL